MKLREHQHEPTDATLLALRRKQNPLILWPTGTGKTVIGVEVVRRWIGKRKRALIVCGMDVLIAQWIERFTAFGITAEVEKAGRRASSTARVVIASAQTAWRSSRLFDPDAFALVVFDEAHHTPARTWTKIANHYRSPRLGLTATADRLDGKTLGLFNVIAHELDMLTAIERGLIVPLVQRSVVVEAYDLTQITRRYGDLDRKQMDAVCRKVDALQAVAVTLIGFMGDRRTVAFASSVRHARFLAKHINRIRPGTARALTGKDKNRETHLAAFRAGKFQVLVGCDLFREGFDEPSVSCIVMARPTASRLLYAQSVGRGTRLHPGKVDCLVMDFVGNAGRHSLVTSFDLVCKVDDTPEMKRAAKKIVEDAQTTPAHIALERARVLPPEVLERYRIDIVEWQDKACALCGGTIQRKTLSPRQYANQRTCGQQCAGVLRRKAQRRCKHCDQPVTRKHDSKTRYCSRSCLKAARRPVVICAARDCQIFFRPGKGCGLRFCSMRCKGLSQRESTAARDLILASEISAGTATDAVIAERSGIACWRVQEIRERASILPWAGEQRRCKRCDGLFYARIGHKTYCSKDCQAQGQRRETCKNGHALVSGESGCAICRRAGLAKRYAGHVGWLQRAQKCETCDGVFTAKGPRRFCSHACYSRSLRRVG